MLIDLKGRLEALFADQSPASTDIQDLTVQIEAAPSRLRLIHLRANLLRLNARQPEQIRRYAIFRGYASEKPFNKDIDSMTKSLKTIAGYGCYLWIALALTSSASADEKAMDHSKMDHSKMDRQTVAKPEKVVPQKKKLDPAVVKKPKTPPAAS